VLDEADKAPLEVVCVLKAIVEDGRLTLHNNSEIGTDIPIHPDFKMVVLANRAGYPFLGNNFLQECGDIFSCYVVDNADVESEKALLKYYAPDISEEVVTQLVDSFAHLRNLVSEGVLSYPYSTRELVNVTKHLQRFPNDSIPQALRNTFDFDQYNSQTRQILSEAFSSFGLSLDYSSTPIHQLAMSFSLPQSLQISKITTPLVKLEEVYEETEQMKVRNSSYLFGSRKEEEVTLTQRSSQLKETLKQYHLPQHSDRSKENFPYQVLTHFSIFNIDWFTFYLVGFMS
jgi:hypothetical protein